MGYPTQSVEAPATEERAPAPPSARPRLSLLDGLRFVAALLVVLYHYTAWHHKFWNGEQANEAWPMLSQLTMFGNMGVQLFFIISGFVILLSAYGKDLPSFIGGRIGRLFPAYWVAVIVSGILVLFIWPAMGEDRTLWDWAINLTMFQQGFGVPHMDGVYWTLWAELRFYLLIAVLLLLRCMTPRRLLLFTALWPLSVIATSGLSGNWREQLLIPDYAPLFAGGMVLFLIYRFGHSPARWAVLGFNVVFAAYETGSDASREALELVGYAVPAWAFWLIVVGMFAVIALISLTPLRNVSLPGLALAGALTYPLYLLHEVWGWWLIKELSPFINPVLLLFLVVAVMLTASYLVYTQVEKRWGRALSQAVTQGLRALSAILLRLWTILGLTRIPTRS